MKASRYLVVGSPGAARILYAMMHIITNVIDFGMGIQDAIDAPRTYSFATSNRTEMEARIPESVREELAEMGYTRIDVRGDYDLYFGGAQAIMVDPETGLLLRCRRPAACRRRRDVLKHDRLGEAK